MDDKTAEIFLLIKEDRDNSKLISELLDKYAPEKNYNLYGVTFFSDAIFAKRFDLALLFYQKGYCTEYYFKDKNREHKFINYLMSHINFEVMDFFLERGIYDINREYICNSLATNKYANAGLPLGHLLTLTKEKKYLELLQKYRFDYKIRNNQGEDLLELLDNNYYNNDETKTQYIIVQDYIVGEEKKILEGVIDAAQINANKNYKI